MHLKKYLQFPFEGSCLLQIKNNKSVEGLKCELAASVIEIFQSLSFRDNKKFTIPLVLKFDNPNVQSFVLSNYNFPVEHICVDEKGIVDKVFVQNVSKSKAQFIQGYSSFSTIVLAPIGFIKKYKIEEKNTIINYDTN